MLASRVREGKKKNVCAAETPVEQDTQQQFLSVHQAERRSEGAEAISTSRGSWGDRGTKGSQAAASGWSQLCHALTV